jgi:hypothetical protein
MWPSLKNRLEFSIISFLGRTTRYCQVLAINHPAFNKDSCSDHVIGSFSFPQTWKPESLDVCSSIASNSDFVNKLASQHNITLEEEPLHKVGAWPGPFWNLKWPTQTLYLCNVATIGNSNSGPISFTDALGVAAWADNVSPRIVQVVVVPAIL